MRNHDDKQAQLQISSLLFEGLEQLDLTGHSR